MRAVLAEGGREWVGYLERVLTEGQAKDVIRRDIDPKATALLIHDLWMGANLRMLVERNVAPLRSMAVFLRRYLTPA